MAAQEQVLKFAKENVNQTLELFDAEPPTKYECKAKDEYWTATTFSDKAGFYIQILKAGKEGFYIVRMQKIGEKDSVLLLNGHTSFH